MKSIFASLVLALALASGGAQAQTHGIAKSSSSMARSAAAAAAPLVDINSASKEQLDKLKGVGPARANAIIKGRPYSGKDDLVRKKVLPKSVYDGIKDSIVARQH